jgi:hypothetical protein
VWAPLQIFAEVGSRKEVMNRASMIPQREAPGATFCEYPKRFNLVDIIGISHNLSPVSPQPDESSPPKEDSYSTRMFDWEVVSR